MRKLVVFILFFFALDWTVSAPVLAENNCAANFVFKTTAPDPVILETEMNLMKKFRPFVVTYPFVNQKGQEVLVVMAEKFPLSENFPIMEIPSPQGLKERWQNFLKRWPKYYYFGNDDLAKLFAAKDLSEIPVDLARINQARVILFPYIKFPRLKDKHEGDELSALHQNYLRTIIEALHKIGFRTELGELLKDWYATLLITDQTSGQDEMIKKLTREADDRFHNLYGVGILRQIHQRMKSRHGATLVWTNKDSLLKPQLYLHKEKVRKIIKNDPGFYSRALEEADRITEKRKKLAQQGYSEEEIEKILFPDPEQRNFRKRLKEQLHSGDLFRVDNP